MKSSLHAARQAAGAVVALAASSFVLPSTAGAQQLPPPGTSSQEIQQQVQSLGLGEQLRQRILSSGLSASEIRQQLASRGYDPSVLDPYLDSTVQSPPAPGDDVYEALQTLNIQFQPDAARTTRSPLDSLRRALGVSPELLLPDSSAIEKEHDLRVFGLRTFARGGTEFEPMAMGPVPPGYMIGPGDELILILTGDVEDSYRLPVTREGFVVIPQVGQVWVNGLTIDEFRSRLYTELGRAYSGVERGPGATTHFEVTLGRLRSNQLYVTGEVVKPGSYLTSAAASTLNALYQAGGPMPNGSFRSVRVMRDGRAVAEVDLYAYLTRGDNVSDVTLQPGDIIFIPIHGPQVAAKGEVGRPAIYELRDGETLLDLLQFAGGLNAPASLGRARITRILPPSERTEAGLDRTVVEVDLAAVLAGDEPAPVLRNGDEVRVFRIRPELRRVVTVAGAVWKDCALEPRDRDSERDESAALRDLPPVPGAATRRGGMPIGAGDTLVADTLMTPEPEEPPTACTFAFRPGMRAWDAIEAAEGLKPDAFRQRAHIVRLDPADSTLSVFPFSLELEPDGTPTDNPELAEHDAIRVFSRTDFQDSLQVRISGEVRKAGLGSVRFREGLTLGDLLLEAGGLTPEADLTVEVSRRPDAQARAAGQLAETVQIEVDPSYIISDQGIRFYPGDPTDDGPDNGTGADDFVLQPHDHVFVRRLPNLEEAERTIRLEGEVLYPGSYALRTKGERLSDVVGRAGGLTMTAFPGGFRFYREGELVSVDLERVLDEPGSRSDVILLPGDSMIVPEYNPVVVVRGAVNSPAAVMYREGAGLDYYIDNAGGYARHADREAVHVRYANGLGSVRRTFLLFEATPEPGPGSVVTVPLIPEDDRLNWGELVGDIAQVAGAIGTALLIFTRF
jgi:polysaccharide export outer membrane protein